MVVLIFNVIYVEIYMLIISKFILAQNALKLKFNLHSNAVIQE
jgi:hypothetical protein